MRAAALDRKRGPDDGSTAVSRACACSRDTARPSRWTVATAAATLRGLHDAGLLEVAYGGGEPFAFRGFADLVAELDTTTTLAQYVTPHGTRIDDAMWPAFAGRFGIVRLSTHDDCEAGRDVVSTTSDGRVQARSFHACFPFFCARASERGRPYGRAGSATTSTVS